LFICTQELKIQKVKIHVAIQNFCPSFVATPTKYLSNREKQLTQQFSNETFVLKNPLDKKKTQKEI
jgi:hypothetical protein